jgi:MFS family permease
MGAYRGDVDRTRRTRLAGTYLPTIQRELGVDPVHLPWIVNAYIVAFGALLLVGGRVGDLWGRRRSLQLGLALFVLGSLAGGLGQSADMLILARAAQGVGAALTAPNALALITSTFSERKTRDSALALYGAMSGLGIVVGLLLGGVLTDTLGWRWVFFIDVPIGLLVLLGSRTPVAPDTHRGQVGALGAALGTGGMVALVYAITRFGEDGLTDPSRCPCSVAPRCCSSPSCSPRPAAVIRCCRWPCSTTATAPAPT